MSGRWLPLGLIVPKGRTTLNVTCVVFHYAKQGMSLGFALGCSCLAGTVGCYAGILPPSPAIVPSLTLAFLQAEKKTRCPLTLPHCRHFPSCRLRCTQ